MTYAIKTKGIGGLNAKTQKMQKSMLHAKKHRICACREYWRKWGNNNDCGRIRDRKAHRPGRLFSGRVRGVHEGGQDHRPGSNKNKRRQT